MARRTEEARSVRGILQHIRWGIVRWGGSINRAFESTAPIDIYLWLVVLIAMSLDIGLTIFGLQIGLIEQNPIALFGIRTFGYAVLAFLKVPAILIGFIGWVVLPPRYRRLNLVGLALPWVEAVIVNSWLIATN